MEPGPPATVAQVDVLLSVPKVTFRISSSVVLLADEAAYPVGSVCGPAVMALEYTFNVLVEPLQMVVKLAFKLSITGLALTVTLIDAMAEQLPGLSH